MYTNLKDDLTIDEEGHKKEEEVSKEINEETTEEKKVVDVPVVLTDHVLEAKKNNTPVIILVAVILVVIVMVLAIATAVINKNNNVDETTLEEKCKQAYNCERQLNGGYICNYKSEENGEITKVTCLAQYIEAEAPTTTTKKIGQQVTTKENSILNPAKKDTWLFASVYYVEDNTKIPVKLTNITKGEEAEEIVKEVTNKGTYIPSLRNQDEEYIVIDYIVDGNGFNEYVSSKLNVYITRQYEETRTLEKDGKLYIPQVTYITNSQDTSGKNSTSRVVVNIPKDFNEYNIVIGEETHSRAYYQGE